MPEAGHTHAKTIATFQKRLVNLNAKNKSLYLPKVYKSQFLDICDLDYTLDRSASDYLNLFVQRVKKIKLCPLVDINDEKSNAVSHHLRQLYRKQNLLFEETGVRSLFIGFPFIQGKTIDQTPIRAPLLLASYTLQIDENHWALQHDEGLIQFNLSLILALSKENHQKTDIDSLNNQLEVLPEDLTGFLTGLFTLMKNEGFGIDFNPESFEKRIRTFQSFTKSQFDQETKQGRLKQIPNAVLGFFPQSDSFLSRDYEWMQQSGQELERVFKPTEDATSAIRETVAAKSSKEEELKAIFPLDAWQEEALRAVKAGASIVVQGPPGSGKSQLICNLISDTISQKKNVLVVCQKRAALDIIANRIAERGLEQFVALVHDHQADRSAIYQQIAEQINQLDHYRQENATLDKIILEREFLRLSREIDLISEEIDEFRRALFDASEAGISPKELYLTSSLDQKIADFKKIYRNFDINEQHNFSGKLKNYILYAEKYLQPNYTWRNRISFAKFGIGEFQLLKKLLQEIPTKFDNVVKRIRAITSMELELEDCQWITDRAESFDKLKALLNNETIYQYFQQSIRFSTAHRITLETARNIIFNLFDDGVGVEQTIPKEDLISWIEKVDEALARNRSWYSKIAWRHLSSDRRQIDNLLLNNGLSGGIEDLKKLAKRLDNRLNLEHQLTKLKSYQWMSDRPSKYEKSAFEKWFNQHIQALEGKEVFEKLRNVVKYVNAEKDSYQEFERKLDLLQDEASKLVGSQQEWLKYLSYKQIKNITKDASWAEKLLKSLETDFEGLCAFDKMADEMQPFELEAIEILLGADRSFDYEQLNQLFFNSVRVAWIEHFESKYPVLRLVSSGRLEQMENDLRQAIDARQDISKEMVLMQVKERVYDQLEFNRLKNMVTYRELKHQVNKKRNIYPLRKLIEEHDNEVFDLIPCWLASPETVSAIFPLEKVFDLIIFDEASQCYAERGVPSMIRGRQVVVCGDSKQLPPSDLYRSRWDDSDISDIATEIDALLDLASYYLPTYTLKGHYRSKSSELIEFSNRWFYSGELRMLPDLSATVSTTPAIEYYQVNGVWKNQVNEAEAIAVSNQVQYLIERGRTNIGIITFNQPQQDLIHDILDQSEISLPESVFIKNIENVQGDERDIIIFSIGYAPSVDGKFRAQFGLLSQDGGENRLNVAITRARYKVIVITSIKPEQLKVSESKYQGPKLLRKYLEYAWNVSRGEYQPISITNSRHSPDWYLKQKVSERFKSFGLKDDLPFADWAKAEQQRGWLVMTDDDLYEQAMTAKNAHAYIPTLLESKGWRFKRFYSREYWRNPEEFFQKLERFLNTDAGLVK